MSYTKQSTTPLYSTSASDFLIACNLVLTTSIGFTAKAALEPATQPDAKEHQNTASPDDKKTMFKLKIHNLYSVNSIHTRTILFSWSKSI